MYLKACANYGLKEQDLFQVNDLYENKNLYMVVDNLYSLGGMVSFCKKFVETPFELSSYLRPRRSPGRVQLWVWRFLPRINEILTRTHWRLVSPWSASNMAPTRGPVRLAWLHMVLPDRSDLRVSHICASLGVTIFNSKMGHMAIYRPMQTTWIKTTAGQL